MWTMSDDRRTAVAVRAAVVCLALVFLTGVTAFQVRESEVAVVTTFGRPSRPITSPGLYARWPWPVQRVQRFDGRLQVLDTPLEQSYTKDERHVLVELFAVWRIADPTVYFERVGAVEEAQRRLRALLSAWRSAVLGRHTLGGLLTADAAAREFERVETEIRDGVKAEAARDGLAVELVGIRRLALPEAVAARVLDRMRQERVKVAEELRSEGRRKAAEMRAAASEEAARILADAQAQATRLEGEGERAAAPSYRVLAQKPALASFLQELSALQDVVGDGKTTLVLPADGPVLRLLSQQGLPTGEAAR